MRSQLPLDRIGGLICPARAVTAATLADAGALALLARIPEDAARDSADVAAISRVAGDPEDLETLDAYCATGSLRRAADRLHLHHGSVARRPEEIVRTLGVQLTEPTALFRDRPALIAWRLLED
ncbi:LysR family transcriptional regulator [Streptomyces sp. NPDC085866]|uniref:LysR family transcriptional regulator n=1 Tax=Streptomyces sp. NPDC085866 TaxID=3365736 RepID=UPI0037D31CA3